MSLLPSLPASTSSTSPGSSTCSTPRAHSLAPKDLQAAPPTYSDEEESQDNYRGPYSDSKHPSVRVTHTDGEEKSSSLPSSNNFNDRAIFTFRNSSKSPGPSFIRDEGELLSQTSDQPLSHSWWGEEKHVVKPKKKTEQTEALQSTRKVSNNNILGWVSSSRVEREWAFQSRYIVHMCTCLCRLF